MDKLSTLTLPNLQGLANLHVPPQYLKPLAALGGLYASYQLYRLSSFTWYHFLRPYNLSKYKKGVSEPWALVTGASDGIGLGFAEELASQGFNVILHGRNEQKLQGVRQNLQSQWPGRKFRLLLLDAIDDAGDSAKMAAALSEFKDLDIKVLINNVGGTAGGKPSFRKFSEMPAKLMDAWIDVNLRFPTQFTRQILSTLIKKQPALILNISSGAANWASPWLSIYSGAKAFNLSWSRSLAVEFLDEGYDIDCHCIVVGPTATARLNLPVDMSTPTPRRMAKASLGYAGTGIRDVAAYWGHDYLMWCFNVMPLWYSEGFVRKFCKEFIAREVKEMEEEAKRK